MAFFATLVKTVLPCPFDCTLVGFSTRVAKEHFFQPNQQEEDVASTAGIVLKAQRIISLPYYFPYNYIISENSRSSQALSGMGAARRMSKQSISAANISDTAKTELLEKF